MKVLIFDSGPLINFTMNGLLDALSLLKQEFKGKFIITDQVKYEVVDRPLSIHRFELGALKIQSLINSGVLEMPSSMGIKNEEIDKLTQDFMNNANKSLQYKGSWVNIVSPAEMSCLALSFILNEENTRNMIAIDERTTRILCENPERLENLMESKLHQNLDLNPLSLEKFHNFKFLRSPELVYVAYKKGLLGLNGKKALEAALYATKFKGASISFEEIEELKRL